jgi:uncharacterized protein (DUF924 family)
VPVITARDILEFWFSEAARPSWFKASAAFDQAVETALRPAYEQALAGRLEVWRSSAEGCLALCLLLDQVPRNLFRGTAQAYSSDLFIYLPLEHSENLADQEDCCTLIAALDGEASWVDYALRHREIIARFGRFPHRNAVLGRENSAAEQAFLSGPGSSF